MPDTAAPTVGRPRSAYTTPQTRTCGECGVVSRWPRGADPDWSKWVGDRCPSCARWELRDGLACATDEERDRRILELLRQGMNERALEKVGIHRWAIRKVKAQAIKDGLLQKPGASPRPAKPSAEERKRERLRKRSETLAAKRKAKADVALAVLREHPEGLTRRQLRDCLPDGIGVNTALKELVRSGRATRSDRKVHIPGRMKPAHTYRAAG